MKDVIFCYIWMCTCQSGTFVVQFLQGNKTFMNSFPGVGLAVAVNNIESVRRDI